MKRFADFTAMDFELLARLAEQRSLREIALALQLDPANISRRVAELESKLELKLITRSNAGIQATHDGHQVAEEARRVLGALRAFDVGRRTRQTQSSYADYVTIGARGFLNTFLAASVLRALGTDGEAKTGLRFLDQSPDESRVAAKRGLVDMVLGIEADGLGRAWESCQVGELKWRLYARSRHPLCFGGKVSDLQNYRVAHHCFFNGQRLQQGAGMLDSIGIEHNGHGTETVATALALVRVSDQVVCAPSLVTQPMLEAGQIQELHLDGFSEIRTPLYLTLHVDRISSASQKKLRRELSVACAV